MGRSKLMGAVIVAASMMTCTAAQASAPNAMVQATQVAALNDSKSILLRSLELDPLATEPIKHLALAKFDSEVLSHIETLSQADRAYRWLLYAQHAKHLGDKSVNEVIERAIVLSLQATDPSGTAAARELTMAAMLYKDQGNLAKAKEVFVLALKAAADNDAHRTIAEELFFRQAAAPNWTVLQLDEAIKGHKGRDNHASSYRYMADIAIKNSNWDLAQSLVKVGNEHANKITERRMRNLHLQNLSKSQARIELKSSIDMLTHHNVVKAARAGKYELALSLISNLGENLYVSHKQDAFRDVFDDAGARKDIKTAEYFLKNGGDTARWISSKKWTDLAQLQIHAGKKKDAQVSYSNALEAVVGLGKIQRYDSDVIALTKLIDAMLQSGLQEQARQALAHAIEIEADISDKHQERKIKAIAALIPVMITLGQANQTRGLIDSAMKVIETEDKASDKAKLLAIIGAAVQKVETHKSHAAKA